MKRIVINASDLNDQTWHNYITMMNTEPCRELLSTGVYITEVSHEMDCAIFSKMLCNCKPSIFLVNASTFENEVEIIAE